MYKSMKIKNLKNYGISSYIVNIWEKHYSRYLLPLQEEAVRNYGVLSCGENEDKEGRMLYAPTEGFDKREDACNDGRGITGLPSPLSRGQAYYAPHNDNISPSPCPLPSRGEGKKE
jgi:hypothetical protein